MRFKVDENLPQEVSTLLNTGGFDAMSVNDQGIASASDGRIAEIRRQEIRILITADLDFSDIR